MLNYEDYSQHVNVGTGEDLTISDLVYKIQEVVGYKGKITWNPEYPDGTPKKQLDVTKLEKLGWKASTSLESGLRETYKWFLENYDTLRK